jgi:uncharacterized protein with GYD domain
MINVSFWNWVLGKTTIDEKVIATVKETKKRVKAVKEEIDVADKRSW